MVRTASNRMNVSVIMQSSSGVGASVPRKEDDRLLTGRGQYIADFRMPGALEVAFVRSTVAHGRIRAIHVPDAVSDGVFTAKHLVDVKPIRAATALPGFKHSSEPILVSEKVRYVGELVAMCVASSRAEAEDIAGSVQVEYDELPAVSDLIAAREPGAPLVHEEWGDNVFLQVRVDADIDAVARTAPIAVTREFRTSRQCMFPIEGRGCLAYRDARLGYLTIVSSTQMPHIVQIGIAHCLGVADSAIRVIAPDVGGGFGYKGLLLREEVALAWLTRQLDRPVRWLEDCRERLDREPQLPGTLLSHHRICRSRWAAARARLRGQCRFGRLFGLSNVVGLGSLADREPASGAVRLQGLSLPSLRRLDQQMPDPALSRRGANRGMPRHRSCHGCNRQRGRPRTA